MFDFDGRDELIESPSQSAAIAHSLTKRAIAVRANEQGHADHAYNLFNKQSKLFDKLCIETEHTTTLLQVRILNKIMYQLNCIPILFYSFETMTLCLMFSLYV